MRILKKYFLSLLTVLIAFQPSLNAEVVNRNFYAAYTPAAAVPVAQPYQYGTGLVPAYPNNNQQVDLPFLVSAASTLYAASQFLTNNSPGAVYGSGARSSQFRDEREAAPPRRQAPSVREPIASNPPRRQDPPRSQNQPLESIPGRSIVIENSGGSLARWKGCAASTLQMIGMNNRCTDGRFHPAFARHMEKTLFPCMVQAAERAGLPKPVRGYIGNMSDFRSGAVIAGSSRPSYHSAGRALDIGKFVLVDEQGKSTSILAHIREFRQGGPKAKFYNAFRACWSRNLPRSCSGGLGSIGCNGSNGTTNGDHYNHIHIEFENRCGG